MANIKRKTKVTDAEGNTVITKKRTTNLFGPKNSSKVITKYADPVSSGRKRSVETYSAPSVPDSEIYKKKGGAMKKAHPGFKSVQSSIASKQGISKKAAGAILASSTRKASAKAKAANPRLKKVKG